MSEGTILRRRALIPTIVVVVLTSVSLAISVPDVILPWQPMSVYGFHLNRDGEISTVVPGYAAADAGIVNGDRIDLKST